MRRILLDTDLAMGTPGSDIDDGFALALALADPELRVDLVTTVHGNTDVDTATKLTRQLLERLGHPDILVVRGAATRLAGTPRPTPATGETGPGTRRAPIEIADRVLAEPGELTIVGVGPLTNIAVALLLAPEVATAVREIVVMGGVYLEHTGVAAMPGEFNFWSDPDAAAVVLRSGAALRLVGLDVTRRVRLTREQATAMARAESDFMRFAGECTLSWIDHRAQAIPGDPLEHDSCALHDPLAVAVVTRPGLVTWRDAYVTVETASPVNRGMAVTDVLTSADPPAANCQIAAEVESDRFVSLFLDHIGRL